MFWVAKAFFKGDPDFSYDNYPSLPYEFAFEAYISANKRRMMELHEYERPLALQTSQQANMNRDPKKNKKPYPIEDFYMYQPKELSDTPSERYGASALWLVQEGMFPGWALFCFQELRKGAGGNVPPLVAFIGEGALLLAPVETSNGWTGMLVASQEAAGEKVKMTSPCGVEVQLLIPPLDGQVVAEENVELRLALG